MKRYMTFTAVSVAATMVTALMPGGSLARAAQKPNILVVWGDDVG